MNIRVHIVVKGMVQGVGFRYFVMRNAMKLNLKGFVRNLPNGNVEIEAEGNRSLIEELIGQVKIGPRSGHVENLDIKWMDRLMAYQTFEVW